MADLYTSYETSIALRDAGAPQDASQRKPRWCPVNRKHGHVEVMMSNYPQCERAFRADEIIEALYAATGLVDIGSCDDEWDVACGRACCAATEPTLVEALARTWLNVLKEGK